MFSEKELSLALRSQDEWGGSDGGAELEEPETKEEDAEEEPEKVDDAEDDSEEDEFE